MCNVVSCCSAKFHFFNSYGPSSPEMNSGDYGTRFMESHSIVNMSCKSAILKKSSNKSLYSGKPFEGCDVCISVFPQECRDISYMRWENKSPFDSILSQQRLWQKLSTSVDVHQSYSVQYQCRTEAWWAWTVCLRPDSITAAIWTQALLRLSPAC